MSRRGLLGAGAATLATGCATRGGVSPFAPAVQLWTVNAELAADLEGGLARLAALGLEAVEAAGLHRRSAEAFRRALDAAGLRCAAVHVAAPDLAADPAGRSAEARTLGAKWLVCSVPLVSRPLQGVVDGASWTRAVQAALTADDWRRTGELLTRAAEAGRGEGVRLAYHNHAFEFARWGEATGLELLFGAADRRAVALELDVGWTVAGGVDPVAFLRSTDLDVRLLHLKDARRDASGWSVVELGRGVVDWPAVLEAARTRGVEHAFVEQEPPFSRSPFDALAESLGYLRRL